MAAVWEQRGVPFPGHTIGDSAADAVGGPTGSCRHGEVCWAWMHSRAVVSDRKAGWSFCARYGLRCCALKLLGQ